MDITARDHAAVYGRIQGKPNLRITGPGASSVKYDILTALLATAANDDSPKARLALRLSLIITARFNWRLGAFNIGLKELARMWGVTERTAKREMALLRSLKWITLERTAARGRVAQHRIELGNLLTDTMPYWSAVGPDFVERMSGTSEPAPTNVIPLRNETASLPIEDGTIWPQMAATLMAQDPAVYSAWFAALSVADCDDGILVLTAQNRFVARYVTTHFHTLLVMAAASVDRSIRHVKVVFVE